MLRQEVVYAVAAGRFHIYPISYIDQGIELLTGVPAGVADSAGEYPEDTINGKVQQRLAKLAEEEAKKGENLEEETSATQISDGKEEE
jgi:hypothetical protein